MSPFPRLFRYPLTAPIELLDLAQDITVSDWHTAISAVEPTVPFASAFRALRPLKVLTLQQEAEGQVTVYESPCEDSAYG